MNWLREFWARLHPPEPHCLHLEGYESTIEWTWLEPGNHRGRCQKCLKQFGDWRDDETA